MTRQVSELSWVERSSSPWKVKKAAGLKAKGLAWERSFFKRSLRWYPDSIHNPWFRFSDAFGIGFACPDIVCLKEGIVFECKLSWTPAAIPQLQLLYIPLLEKFYEKAFRGIIAVKYWRGGEPPLPILATPWEASPKVGILL